MLVPPPRYTLLAIVREGLPVVAKASVAAPATPLASRPNCNAPQAAFAISTVNVAPRTYTLSEEFGNPPVPEPVVIALQFVLAVIVTVAALAFEQTITIIINNTMVESNMSYLFFKILSYKFFKEIPVSFSFLLHYKSKRYLWKRFPLQLS